MKIWFVKFLQKKSTNTCIIDLDDHKQVSLTVNDNNIIDLGLAELSQLVCILYS